MFPVLRLVARQPAPRAARFAPHAVRAFCAAEDASTVMGSTLRAALEASHVEVKDISGGCGSMYEVLVVSGKFEGVGMVNQHRMVHDTLKEEIGEMHGLRVTTKTPAQWGK